MQARPLFPVSLVLLSHILKLTVNPPGSPYPPKLALQAWATIPTLCFTFKENETTKALDKTPCETSGEWASVLNHQLLHPGQADV